MKKSILYISVIIMAVGLVGCQVKEQSGSESVGTENASEVVYSKVKKNTRVVSYGDFEIKFPKDWICENVDGVDLYRNVERLSNISVTKVLDEQVDSYMEDLKKYNEENLKVDNVSEEILDVNGVKIKSIKYDYTVPNGDNTYVEQSLIQGDGCLYVLTLLSNENNYMEDVEQYKKILETIKVKHLL